MHLRYIFHLDYEIELIIFDIILHHIQLDKNTIGQYIVSTKLASPLNCLIDQTIIDTITPSKYINRTTSVIPI